MWYLVPLSKKDVNFIPVEDKSIIGRQKFEVVVYNEHLHNTGLLDASVTHRHAELVVENDMLKIRDLGSKNGTFIDGVVLKEWRPKKEMKNYVELCPGEILRCGAQSKFKVEQEKNKLTVRHGESVQLPKDVVEELVRAGMRGHTGTEPHIVGIQKDEKFSAKKLNVEIVDVITPIKRMFFLADGLKDAKELIKTGKRMDGYRKLVEIDEIWHGEMGNLLPERYMKIKNYIKAENEGKTITDGTVEDVLECLDIFISKINKEVELWK